MAERSESSFDSRRGISPFYRSKDADECYQYVSRLIGKDPTVEILLDYARRVFDAAVIAERWQEVKNTVVKLSKEFDSKQIDLLSMGHATGVCPKSFNNIPEDLRNLSMAIDIHFINKLRKIFNDPNGQYLLGWHDFCHTGRTAPILSQGALMECSRMLINQAEDCLNGNHSK